MASKTDIELARAAIKKVTRAEVRLRYSLMADEELNTLLDQRIRDFDIQLQAGTIPALALKLVTGDDAAE